MIELFKRCNSVMKGGEKTEALKALVNKSVKFYDGFVCLVSKKY